jgi:hypothetical protein
MVLSIPLVYVMRSSSASLISLIGITYYAAEKGYFTYHSTPPYFYFLLLAALIPHYVLLIRQNGKSPYAVLHHVFVPLSVLIAYGTFQDHFEELMLVGYVSLFSLFVLIGRLPILRQHQRTNGYILLGSIGNLGLLLFLSFDFFWENLQHEVYTALGSSQTLWACVLVSCFAMAFLIQKYTARKGPFRPEDFAFLLVIFCFIIGDSTTFSIALINIALMLTGVWYIWDGINTYRLLVLNYGLAIVAALVVCRFFDADIPFYVRGILFVLVGAVFFVANVQLLKKKRQNEKA